MSRTRAALKRTQALSAGFTPGSAEAIPMIPKSADEAKSLRMGRSMIWRKLLIL
ncbi:MAG TPA: hypothetical protein PK377_02550 [Methanothrix sp.]|jgi:hypothetical protein|nr:hypothetical protein [Methanothrix sp.]